MKALKLSAVIFTALAALSACKTAPGGGSGSADAKVQEGLNDALGEIGGVAGMTGYSRSFEGGGTDPDLGSIQNFLLWEFYLSADGRKSKSVNTQVYSGKYPLDDGSTPTFNNEIISKKADEADITDIASPADGYKFYHTPSGGSRTELTGLSGYKIVEIKQTVSKQWGYPKFDGGTGNWEAESRLEIHTNYLKIDGSKLYKISIMSMNTGSKEIDLRGDASNPVDGGPNSSAEIYTKK